MAWKGGPRAWVYGKQQWGVERGRGVEGGHGRVGLSHEQQEERGGGLWSRAWKRGGLRG